MLFDLWPLVCRGVLLTLLSSCAILFSCYSLVDLVPPPWLFVLASVAAAPLLAMLWRDRALVALARRTSRFQTQAVARIVLRYDPEARSALEATELLARAERILEQLEAKFGRLTLYWHGRTLGPLLFRRRIHVYLFSRGEALQEAFGDRYLGGVALTALHAVALPFDGLPFDETLKHEIAHLFTDRWNLQAPFFLREGVSTCLQETFATIPIDALAAAIVHHERRPLFTFLNARCFLDDATCGVSYVLAGSFTGYLLRRFGWSAFKRFFQRLGFLARFDAQFRRRFGISLDEAESEWANQLREQYGDRIVDPLTNERRKEMS